APPGPAHAHRASRIAKTPSLSPGVPPRGSFPKEKRPPPFFRHDPGAAAGAGGVLCVTRASLIEKVTVRDRATDGDVAAGLFLAGTGVNEELAVAGSVVEHGDASLDEERAAPPGADAGFVDSRAAIDDGDSY